MKRILLIMAGCGLLNHSQAQFSYGTVTHTLSNNSVIVEAATNFFKTPIYLTANQYENAVKLVWHTPTRANFKGFEISRSTDGERFEHLSWIGRQEDNNDFEEYTYEDYSVEQNQKYIYRLKKLNEDGSIELAQVEAVAIREEKKVQINVVPKVEETEVLAIMSNTEGIIKIFNSLGHPIAESRLVVGQNIIDTSFWSKGKYYVAFETATGEKILKKFYK
jgi:hypothetical protein